MDETSTIGRPRSTTEPLVAGTVVTRIGEISLQEMVSVHQQQVARTARRLLGPAAGPEGIEDVVQEVFLSAFLHRDRFRGDSSLSTWLTSVTVNKCRSLIRRRAVRRRLFPWMGGQSLSDQGDGSLDRQETHEINEEVRRAVYRLPQKYREPVVLRYFESMSPEEIAAALGLAANTVEVRLSRARKKLKTVLAHRLRE